MKNILFALFLLTEPCCGQSTFLPVSDGSVYSNGGIATTYVAAYASEAPAGLEGDLQFASFDSSPYRSISLELNLGSSPLGATTLYVYGYDNASGVLSSDDYNAGTYLGLWNISPDLAFNQQIFFDVTAFVQSEHGSFFGIEFRVDNQDVGGAAYFTSTEYNNGIPPALIADVPEPHFPALFSLGFGCWVIFSRVSSMKTRPRKRVLI